MHAARSPLVFAIVALLSIEAPAASLPRLTIDASRVSAVGLSSGAFMAAQLGVAHSNIISGVAVFAGGAYACAKLHSEGAAGCMLSPENFNASRSVALAQEEGTSGKIDPVENIAKQRIFLFSGMNDSTTLPTVTAKLGEFYRALGVKSIINENSVRAGHGQPTKGYGNACEATQSPWLVNCNYDGAANALAHLYGPINERGKSFSENIHTFDQAAYGSPEAFLGDTGSIYIPAKCSGGKKRCGLVIALHGCMQSPDLLGNEFRDNAGYNEVAEANDFVVLYPSTKATALNPRGCWDWWGYSGTDFYNHNGPQIKAIRSMIKALSGH